MQRVKDRAWDDVERKIKPVETPKEEPAEHKEVRVMMSSLFTKLDALSNFHYTPRPPVPDMKIVSNLPAITLEEVAPVATSDAALLAPEEVKGQSKGNVIGKAERTVTDKKREHRKKKAQQRKRKREQVKREQLVEKLRPGLGNKYSKEKAKRDLENVIKNSNVTQMEEKDSGKAVKSSTAFFNQLQDEVKTLIKRKTTDKDFSKNSIRPSAKRLKL
ncbi:U3 small nucleolar ribonucleoprotein MPP10 [Blattella germanica]|nr:U3 small nucleolar ribonucleoprotein MPP10 [Blattella germanica]